MFSLRLHPDEIPEIDLVISTIKNLHNIGVDLAFYHHKDGANYSEEQINYFLNFPEPRKTMHFNHSKYTGNMMCRGLDNAANYYLLRDFQLAKLVGIKRGVLHWNADHCEGIPTPTSMKNVLNIFRYNDIIPYVENVDSNFYNHRNLVQTALDSGGVFGLCFDIGHAKLWGGASFHLWFDWLSSMKQFGVPLMFHIHSNHGLNDDHLPVWSDEDCDKGGTLEVCIAEVVNRLYHSFSDCTFVIENKATSAHANLLWIEQVEACSGWER